MLARACLEIETKAKERFPYQKAIVLQGIIMERIDSEYAEVLHESKLHPYSQFITNKEGKNIWVINAFNKETYEKIILPIMDDDFNKFKIEHNDTEVTIVKKSVEKMTKNDFMRKFYFDDSDKYIKILFNTPTAFKRDGVYVNYPDISLIYGSLMRKYDSASEQESLISEELLEDLVKATKVVKYDLHSYNYNIGTSKIPAFMGDMTFRIDGTQGIVNFANMLFRFGEYSGVGIKTAMGMGNIKIVERVEK